MRAVNLIPLEERNRASGGSGLSAFGVLAALGLLVVAVVASVVVSNEIGSRKADLASAQSRVAAARQRAENLKPYASFAQMKEDRVRTVTQLAQTRFDWEGTMSDLARVVTPNVWITSFTGTVAPGVTIDGGGSSGGASTLRSALPNPAAELAGCAVSNDEVARLVSRLRAMRRVARVSLASAVKNDSGSSSGSGSGGSSAGASVTGAAGGGSAGGSDCTAGSDRYPAFSLVIFFQPLPGGSPASSSGSAGAAPAAAAAPAASSTPAASAGSSAPAAGGGATPASAGGAK